MGGAHKQPGLLMSIKTSPQQDEAELYALERGCKEFIHCFIEFNMMDVLLLFVIVCI